MRNQCCLAVVLGGPQHCRVLTPREIAVEVVDYDVYMAGAARDHRSLTAFHLPEIRNERMIYAQD
jgi:hypothetical protein